MRELLIRILAMGMLFAAAVQAQDKPQIRDTEPRPVAPADDPVNKWVSASSVDALVIVLTIDGALITLDSATPARVPRASTVRAEPVPGDRVTVTGFAEGAKVSDSAVPDQVLNAQEGVGLVRVSKRQVMLSLAAPRALDTIEISAPATGATARFDVRAAYAPYCKGEKPDPRYCPPRQSGN
ncbi:MAG: hypothetical protein WBX11_09145 [Thiobacillaceae bacterium]